jgi:hypothetical protein
MKNMFNKIELEMLLHSLNVVCEFLDDDGDEELQSFQELLEKVQKMLDN